MSISVREPAFKIRSDGTDTWAELQALFDLVGSSEPIEFDDGLWRISRPLRMSVGGRYFGRYRLGRASGTAIQGIGNTNLFEMPNLTPDGGLAAVALEGLQLVGGNDHIYAPNGADWVTLRDITFNTPGHAAIYGRSFLQNWSVENIDVGGGQYGFYYPFETGRDGGNSILFDKSRFVNVSMAGQSVNAWLVTVKLSNNVHWESLKLINAKQDGFVFGGGIRMWTFLNVNTEGNGYLGSPKPANSPAQFSDFKSVGIPGIGGPAGISWYGASVGTVVDTNQLLYGMDLSQMAGSCSAYECQSSRPIYDPKNLLQVYGRPLRKVA